METPLKPSVTRVLMLGWEYPPRYVGGLGKASQGIARGLAHLGLDVLFVLPKFNSRRSHARLRVLGARNWLLQRGTLPPASVGARRWIGVPANLNPYARPRPTHNVPPNAADTRAARAAALYGSDMDREVARFAEQVDVITADADADVIHAHDWMTFPAAMNAAQHHHLPLFVHVHSTEYDRAGTGANPAIVAIERAGCEHATGVFAVSDYTRNILVSRYGIDAEKVWVVYNAPDGPIAAAEVLPPESREPWIVFLGRLTFQKGPDHFLRAAAIVAQYNSQVRFLICGGGDMRDALQVQAQQLGISERVEFRGFLAPRNVDRMLGRSSLLVMPSVSEPFGLVALEALRAGTPVIVSRQSGVREVLGHSLQVDFWDHEKLADQMLAVLRLPVLAEQLVTEGRAQLATLSWDLSAQHIVDAYTRTGINCAVDWAVEQDNGA